MGYCYKPFTYKYIDMYMESRYRRLPSFFRSLLGTLGVLPPHISRN